MYVLHANKAISKEKERDKENRDSERERERETLNVKGSRYDQTESQNST